jgi:hypothetical protein
MTMPIAYALGIGKLATAQYSRWRDQPRCKAMTVVCFRAELGPAVQPDKITDPG